MIRDADPHQLARDLLGREFDDLEADEQRVLRRVASGSFTGRDADELAQGHETRGDRLADRVAEIGGSWRFIIGFGVVLMVWVVLNSGALKLLGLGPFDAYPFIFLNLMLSMLAAVQAPIILMSQNRQARKDRINARHDYEVNLRTQLEILRLAHRVEKLAQAAHAERKEAAEASPKD
ncbi:putative membrane protein [Erythromicrobium ramosum]|uniref:DUF1003 domain-containing protein n=1 Tax=Erythrobacter ramosus TaxID=35811 RepID=A0A6I4ULL5_9SPHN|nr:DUF1003 domain-containing protein [Erythrobacter ramosus]MBB3776475.1 putative membrane protein [Erythrobacter ramosus]MXP38447.1 DUF1003 domain-containing protein [Erythrobacter ramosus]